MSLESIILVSVASFSLNVPDCFNNWSAHYLKDFIGPATKKIFLAHLSEENNTYEKAIETLKSVLEEYDIKFDNIEIAKQNEKTELITLWK